MRVLITAGNTREKIDRVRDWGNIFTGNTGFAIARAAARVGEVDLLTSNEQHLAIVHAGDEPRLHATRFSSHQDLKGAIAALMSRERYDAIFMTAAVADYRPAGAFVVLDRERRDDGTERWTVKDVQAAKVKSAHASLAFLGTPTEKLVDRFRTEWKHAGLLVKFKLEVDVSKEDLIRVGQASRRSSGADYLVANTLEMVGGNDAGAFLLSDAAEEWIPRSQLAARLIKLLPMPF